MVDGVSLAVAAGECVAVLGPSGSGKSTLLRVVAGLVAADAGRVEIAGTVTDDPRPRVPPERRGVGFLFQDLALWPHLSLRGNLDFVLEARGVARGDRPREIDDAATAAELPRELLDRRPGDVSGGERQRAALARVLVQAPRLLLLDEPLSHLDPDLRWSLVALLRRLRAERGLTSLLVTHDRSEAFALAQRIVVVRNGRIEQEGTPEEVYERPRTAFVASFVSRAALLPAERRGSEVVTPFGTWPAAGAVPPVPSGPLLAVFRPECVRSVANGADGAPGADGTHGVRGRIVDGYPCGDHWIVTAEVPSGDSSVRVPFRADAGAAVGSEVRLTATHPAFVPSDGRTEQ